MSSSRRELALHGAVHAALLVVVPCALGRLAEATRLREVACVALLVAVGIAEARARRRRDPSRFGAPGMHLALASALALLTTAWVAIGWPSATPPSWSVGLGASSIGFGGVLRVLSIRRLGDAFTSETVLSPGRVLAGDRFYATFRHPSEIGLALVAVGLATLGGSTLATLPGLILAATIALRVIREERVLDHLNY
jgi:protein-S-isoprenylcysteine O-methyltransferase Ste14